MVAAEIFLDRCLKPGRSQIELYRAARQTPPQAEDSDDRQGNENRRTEKQTSHERSAKQIRDSVAQTKPAPSRQAMHHTVAIRLTAHGDGMVNSMSPILSAG